MWSKFRRDPLAWIIGALALVGILGNLVMFAARRDAGQTKVLAKQLVSPTPTQARPPVLNFPHSGRPAVTQTPDPVPTPSASEPATPTCINSTNPACGRFYWSPAPGSNASMKIDVQVSDAEPVPGESISFVVVAADPDAPVASVEAGYGDPSKPRIVTCSSPARYGAWQTPARRSGRLQRTFTHTYAKPGTYIARFRAMSGSVCGSPYASEITIEVPVTVRAVPTESPSPTPSPTN